MHRPILAGLALACLLAAAERPALATTAKDDYLTTVEDETFVFDIDDLLTNDTYSGEVEVTVISGPAHGSLGCGVESCTFVPDSEWTGVDSFVYEIEEVSQGFDATATASLHVTPIVMPLAGDWDGDGNTDLGWYHGVNQDLFFFQIDYSGAPEPADPSTDCVPMASFGLGAGWTPIAGDWDQDGKDEFGFFDPATRQIHLFVRGTGGAWVAQTPFQHPESGQGGAAIAGDWDGDGDDEAGLYLNGDRRFLLLDGNGAGASIYADFTILGIKASDWWPAAGDWGGDGSGIDTIGLWNRSIGNLGVRFTNTTGPLTGSLPYHEESDQSLPVSGSWGEPVSIGFYDPEPRPAGPPHGAFAIYPCDFAFDPEQCETDLGGQVVLLPPDEDPKIEVCAGS